MLKYPVSIISIKNVGYSDIMYSISCKKIIYIKYDNGCYEKNHYYLQVSQVKSPPVDFVEKKIFYNVCCCHEVVRI